MATINALKNKNKKNKKHCDVQENPARVAHRKRFQEVREEREHKHTNAFHTRLVAIFRAIRYLIKKLTSFSSLFCLWCPWLLFLCGIFYLKRLFPSADCWVQPLVWIFRASDLSWREEKLEEGEKSCPSRSGKENFLWTDQNGCQIMPRSVSNNCVCVCL